MAGRTQEFQPTYTLKVTHTPESLGTAKRVPWPMVNVWFLRPFNVQKVARRIHSVTTDFSLGLSLRSSNVLSKANNADRYDSEHNLISHRFSLDTKVKRFNKARLSPDETAGFMEEMAAMGDHLSEGIRFVPQNWTIVREERTANGVKTTPINKRSMKRLEQDVEREISLGQQHLYKIAGIRRIDSFLDVFRRAGNQMSPAGREILLGYQHRNERYRAGEKDPFKYERNPNRPWLSFWQPIIRTLSGVRARAKLAARIYEGGTSRSYARELLKPIKDRTQTLTMLRSVHIRNIYGIVNSRHITNNAIYDISQKLNVFRSREFTQQFSGVNIPAFRSLLNQLSVLAIPIETAAQFWDQRPTRSILFRFYHNLASQINNDLFANKPFRRNLYTAAGISADQMNDAQDKYYRQHQRVIQAILQSWFENYNNEPYIFARAHVRRLAQDYMSALDSDPESVAKFAAALLPSEVLGLLPQNITMGVTSAEGFARSLKKTIDPMLRQVDGFVKRTLNIDLGLAPKKNDPNAELKSRLQQARSYHEVSKILLDTARSDALRRDQIDPVQYERSLHSSEFGERIERTYQIASTLQDQERLRRSTSSESPTQEAVSPSQSSLSEDSSTEAAPEIPLIATARQWGQRALESYRRRTRQSDTGGSVATV